ncbi:uncharacterized protein [Apostichopus japonicus]|uniref:uncharacterized protein isoform X2 n=1 Tax=Stichopus japonicus TaxID=307972 RepID=UPI003AB71A85
MIWGKVLHPGESLTEVVDSEIHLSMASLECRPRLSSKKDLTAHVILRTHTGEYLLCSLGYGPTPQQNLDLVLQPQEEITFSVEGSGVVYLTGYTIPTTEPVSYYGDTGFDEEAIEDCGEVPQDQEDFQQEWEVAASEGTDVTVKSEAQKEDVPQTCGQGEVHSAPTEANEDNLNYQNEQMESSDRLSSQGDEIAVVQLDDEEDEAFTAVKWRLSESTMTGHQQEGQSQQAMQKCLACPNLIPFRGQFEDNEGQLSSNIVLHCKSCLQRLQGSGGHQTLSPRYNKPAQDQMGANRRKRQSWKSSYSVPQNSQTGRVYGTDQRGAGNVSYQLPDERQHRTNKDKLCSYYCSYCSKGFSSSAGLKVHERMHTGEKPYKCRFCPKAFTQCTNWKSHEKTHTGEKPHKCSYCEKTFIRTDAMKSHERTHTGEKPYRCQNCPRAFGQRSMLKKHELLHHFDL